MRVSAEMRAGQFPDSAAPPTPFLKVKTVLSRWAANRLGNGKAVIGELFSSDTLGGILRRHLLLPIIVIPAILEFLAYLGERAGLYGSEARAAILSVSYVFIFALLLWWAVRLLDKVAAEQRRARDEIFQGRAELERANKELEAFSYSVSHDLRAPLRSIDGFSQVLLEDYAERLDDEGKDCLKRVRAAAQRMALLIDDLLNLSRITQTEPRRERVDLSELAYSISATLRESHPQRKARFFIAPALESNGDPRLLQQVLENLFSNAWKFTAKHETATIEFGQMESNGKAAYFVRDDGAGFDPAYADKLFGPFQRLHTENEFPGTGIGLAIVQRIIHRHGGSIWAVAGVERGATFYFTL